MTHNEPETREHIEERLGELYQRHLSMFDDQVETFYDPTLGYHIPEVIEARHKRFAVCLVTTEGEVYHVGDHDASFMLQSLSKVFV